MDMSLLNVFRRKKRKPVREEILDAPTLFGDMGNNPLHEEKKISVLSAAGGKSAKRAKSRRRTGESVPIIRTSYIVLFLGTVLFAGTWHSGVLDRNVDTALAGKLDAWWQAGRSVFDQSGSSPADASAEQKTMVSLPTSKYSARTLETDPSGQVAQIERIELPGLNKTESSTQSPAERLNASLSHNTESGSNAQTESPAAQATEKPAAILQAKAPTLRKAASDTSRTSERPRAKSASLESSRQGEAAEKQSDKKVQIAKSKEPDADAQLLEALLVHVRKTEAARSR